MASSLLHVKACSAFTRVEVFNEFPVGNAKQQHQVRCSTADDWEGNVRVTDKSLRKDAFSSPKPNLVEISSNQRTAAGKSESLIEDENSVTGKSRGEIFLERARATTVNDSSSTGRAQPVLPEVARVARKERKQKREKLAAFVARRDEPCCYGCGAVLQSSAAEAPGFLPLATFEVVCMFQYHYSPFGINTSCERIRDFDVSYKCMALSVGLVNVLEMHQVEIQ